MHYSVGAIIKKGNKYLLIDRVKVPLGFAGVAGHIDKDEDVEDALKREVKEESGLNVINFNLLFEEELSSEKCSRGVLTHYWYIYECEVEGDIKIKKDEVKSINWFSAGEIRKLKLEKAWKYWFKKLGIF